MTKEEVKASKWLSAADIIIIKRADKGGAVVVRGRDQYITEALRQLDNCEYYEPLLSDPREQIKTELTEMLLHAEN